jgi:type I restriction enzyme S subunit
MSKTQFSTLQELCTTIGDGLHGTPNYDASSDIYFVNGNNLENGRIEIVEDLTKRVSEATLRKNFIELNENSLLLSINGTLGNLAFYSGEKVMLGKSVAYMNFRNDLNRFYFYYFQLPEIQKYFWDVATGSTIKNLSLKSINKFRVPVPDPGAKEIICSTLEVVDVKIRNLEEINIKLNLLIRTYFDYWFRQFEFDNVDGMPYSSSGGALKESKELGFKIPEKWKVVGLEDIAPILTGKKDANFATPGGIYNFFTCADKVLKCDDYTFEGKAILVAGNGNFNIKLYDGKFDAYQRTYVIIPTNIDYYAIVYLALQDRVSGFHQGSRGSIVKFITKGDLEDIKIALPIEGNKELFETLNAITFKVQKNIEEINRLRDLKLWLLPNLMNKYLSI